MNTLLTGASSRSAVSSIPNEIWNMIISFLESLDDLLSMALAGRKLACLIIPTHLHHRALRCRFRDDALWRELVASPVKGHAIHRLAVLDRAGDRAEYRVDWTRHTRYFDRFPPGEVPGCVGHAEDPLSIGHGSDWLNKLSPTFCNLRTLTMYLPAMCFAKLRDFFLLVSPQLVGLHLRLSFMHPAVTPEHRAQCTQVVDCMTGRFRHFSLKIEEWRNEVIESVLRSFAKLLRQCDDLENLCMEVENGASTSYQCAELWKARWLKLLTLDLSGLRMEEVDPLEDSDDESALDAEQPNIEQFFLALHSLQALRLDCYAPRTPTIRPDSMPSLQAVGLLGSSLEVQWAMLPTLVSPLSDGSYRPIDSLQWDLKYYPFADSRSGTVFRLFCHHLAKAAKLRQTMLVRSAYGTESFPWVREFGRAVPGIQHLVIDPDGIMSFDTWLELLADYPSMITLNPTNHGIHQPFLKPFSSNLASHSMSGLRGDPYTHSYAQQHAALSMCGLEGMDSAEADEDVLEEEMLYKLSAVCAGLRHVDNWVREDLTVGTQAEGEVGGKQKAKQMYMWRRRTSGGPCEGVCCRDRPPYVRERT